MKIELKVSDKSSVGCRYCHEDATFTGDIAHFEDAFIETLKSGTELIITGKNVFENPHLEDFLKHCQSKELICKLVVEQTVLASYSWVVEKWMEKGLIGGLAITFNGNSEDLLEFLNTSRLKEHKDAVVIQVIYGMQSYTSLKLFFNQAFKLRILGYETYGQTAEGNPKRTYKQELFYNNLPQIMTAFKEVSFDHLAMKQLEVERLFKPQEWVVKQAEMDSEPVIYIDMVQGEFAASVQSEVRYPILSDIDEMFERVRAEK